MITTQFGNYPERTAIHIRSISYLLKKKSVCCVEKEMHLTSSNFLPGFLWFPFSSVPNISLFHFPSHLANQLFSSMKSLFYGLSGNDISCNSRIHLLKLTIYISMWNYYHILFFQLPHSGTCIRRRVIRLLGQERTINAQRSETIFSANHLSPWLLS